MRQLRLVPELFDGRRPYTYTDMLALHLPALQLYNRSD
jgi:hypothetical protein